MRLIVLIASLFALTSAAAAQPPVFDPETLDARAAVAPVEVMVLATPHLSGAPDGFDPIMLDPVLERLAAFAPTHIAVEASPAEHVRFLEREAARYPDLAAQFGGRALELMELAGATVDLDPVAAEAEAAGLLVADENLDAGQRRRAAALLARAGDPWSAAVQWRRLDPDERRPDENLDAATVQALDALLAARNETGLIGVELAARLEHERVHPMDDWSAGDLFLSQLDALQSLMQNDPALAAIMEDEDFLTMQGLAGSLDSAEAALEAYRHANADAPQADRADLEWGAFLAAETDPEAARARVAVWEARNLRMAANIHEAAAGRPGARILVIVGASHKPWLEAYLDNLAAVRIVSAERYLEPPRP